MTTAKTPTTPSAIVLNTLTHASIRIEVRLEFGRVRHRVGYRKNNQVHELATLYIVGLTDTGPKRMRELDAETPEEYRAALSQFLRTGQPAKISSGMMCQHLDADDALPDATLTRAHVTCATCKRHPSGLPITCENCGGTFPQDTDTQTYQRETGQRHCAPCIRAGQDHARAHGLLDDEA